MGEGERQLYNSPLLAACIHSFYLTSDDFVGVSESFHEYTMYNMYVCIDVCVRLLPAEPEPEPLHCTLFHAMPLHSKQINGGRWRFYGILSPESINTAAKKQQQNNYNNNNNNIRFVVRPRKVWIFGKRSEPRTSVICRRHFMRQRSRGELPLLKFDDIIRGHSKFLATCMYVCVCICERYIVGGWVVDDKTCRLPELYE